MNRKIITSLLICACLFSVLPAHTASAKVKEQPKVIEHALSDTANTQTNAKIQGEVSTTSQNQEKSKSTDPYESEEAKEINEIHQYIVQNYKNDIKLNKNGTIEISNLDKLISEKKFKKEYKEWITSVNYCIKNGSIKLNNDFQIQAIPSEKMKIERSSSFFEDSKVSLASERTFDLNSVAWRNGQDMANFSKSMRPQGAAGRGAVYAYFAYRERTGGLWDYKQTLGLNTEYKVTIGGSTFTLTGEQIGNIHYGYVGIAADIPGVTLRSAAGLAQIMAGTYKMSYWSSYFDDPRDQVEINRGIRWRNTYTFS